VGEGRKLLFLDRSKIVEGGKTGRPLRRLEKKGEQRKFLLRREEGR